MDGIRLLRKVKDISQEQLSRRTGLSQQHISDIERKRAPLTRRSARKIAEALEFTQDEIEYAQLDALLRSNLDGSGYQSEALKAAASTFSNQLIACLETIFTSDSIPRPHKTRSVEAVLELRRFLQSIRDETLEEELDEQVSLFDEFRRGTV